MTTTEMDVDKDDQPKAVNSEEAEVAQLTPFEALQKNVQLLDRAVKLKDTRLVMGRLLRQTATVRKQLTPEVIMQFIGSVLPDGSAARSFLLEQLVKTDNAHSHQGLATSHTETAPASALPEVEMYAYLLVIIYFIDQQDYTQAKEVAVQAVDRLAAFNRRTLDVLAARIYYYFSWSYEKTSALADIRGELLRLHQTAVLRHDAIGQETLLNLLLRNYLHFNLYDQAEKLRSKVSIPETSHSNQQYCRYLYYLGRIRAIQLEYTDAKDCLQQAVRKAPNVAKGFRITVSKWFILIRLLLGEIPPRSEFTQRGMQAALRPYFELAQAVRSGDLSHFQHVQEHYQQQFVKDRTHNLIVRLRQNVIRTGLRRISLAYSRISLKDVAQKLGLAAVDDTECIVAKAIRDGGIDAWIDHESSWLHSRQVHDIYSTGEPLQAFHDRIAFCLDIHDEAVKAMRYEPDEHKKQLEDARRSKERAAAEQDLVESLADSLDEDDEF